MEHESDGYANCNWSIRNKWMVKGTGRQGNKRTRRDHPYNSIIKNGQNTEKSPGDLKRLAIAQTPVERLN